MAQDESVIALQKEKALLDAQAGVAQSRVALIEAEAKLADAQRLPDPTLIASTEAKARADAQKALSESQRAASDAAKGADVAGAQAAIGSATGSTAFAGTVTVQTDAGKAEATLLSARAVGMGAQRLVDAVKADVAGKRVALVSGIDSPQFPNYQDYRLRRYLLKMQFDEAIAAYAAAKNADKPIIPKSTGSGLEALTAGPAMLESIPFLTAASVAVDVLSKLGSYFQSNYTVGSISVTKDTELLIPAVAGRLLTNAAMAVVVPSRAVPRLADEALGDLSDLSSKVALAAEQAGVSEERSKELKAQIASDNALTAAQKAQLAAYAVGYDGVASRLRQAITVYSDFLTKLSTPDASGVLQIAKVVQEKAVYDEITRPNTLALFVDVRSAVGGFYTKTNLWTFLGSTPLHTMGGAIITYMLLDASSGAIIRADLIPIHGGYLKIDNVERLFQP